MPEGFAARPTFSREGAYQTATICLARGTSFYATGEQAGPLLRNNTRKLLYNYDRFDYDEHSPSLYQSHPFVLGVRSDGASVGIIFETTWRCEIDLTVAGEASCRTEGPAPAVCVIERDDPAGVLKALGELTGFMPMPPVWALGYHQCRWSYTPASKVLEVAKGFRDRRIPCDVLWLDIDYMNGFRCFTFDPGAFPDPRRLHDDLHAMHFRSVCMIDPGLKVDPEYAVYADALRHDHFVKDAAGKVYEGKVWPGPCAFPDFTRERTRGWWSGLYKDFMAHGLDGVWNDMNEPAVFESPGKTMPDDNRHDADAELGGPGPHTRYHNIYGMQMIRATREGVARANPDKRPFVLTRASFLGGQRYAAMWTGDNRSDWNHMRWSIPMVLNLGLSGQPFAGPDVGGFVGNADGELFARWMGLASLLPFCRAHSIKDSVDHEPWSFGAACEDASRQALQRRYRLLPYLYTLFEEASRTGLPVARPLFFADPSDPRLRSACDSLLLGSDLLVRVDLARVGDVGPDRAAPSPSPMPGGVWREFEPLGTPVGATPALPRLFVRAGSAIPLGPVREHIRVTPDDPITLAVAPDESGRAQALLYEDAGDGHDYQHGAFRRTRFTIERTPGGLTAHEEQVSGTWPKANRRVELIDLTPSRA
jgi:alpha-glucosidase